MTVDESLAAFAPVLARAGELGWWRRGYVSTAFGCPYTGAVAPERAVEVALRLLELGRRGGLLRRHDRRRRPGPGRAADRAGGRRRDRRSSGSRTTSTTRAGRRSPTSRRASTAASAASTRRPAEPAAVRTPRARPGNLATEDLVYLLDAIGLRARRRPGAASSTPRGSSPTRSASRSRRRSARPAAGTPRRASRSGADGPPVEPQSSESAVLGIIRARDGRRRARAEPELRAAERLQPATGVPARVRREGRSHRVRPPGDPDAADGIPRARP